MWLCEEFRHVKANTFPIIRFQSKHSRGVIHTLTFEKCVVYEDTLHLLYPIWSVDNEFSIVQDTRGWFFTWAIGVLRFS